jgi:hypothetical protein
MDGVNGRALDAAATRLLTSSRRQLKGVSRFDASGLFEQLPTDAGDGTVSPRLILLLYAADLAFRLRWEIEPALAEGQAVVAAPYIDTAVAFGLACGLSRSWLRGLFRFARKPSERHTVDAPANRGTPTVQGFVELACARLLEGEGWSSRKGLTDRTRAQLRPRARASRARRVDRTR